MKNGYSNVFCFRGGIQEWRSFNYPLTVNNRYKDVRVKKLSPKKVTMLIESDPDLMVLDVRPQNFAKGPQFIKGAVHKPLIDIKDALSWLPKDRKIIISDWMMRQSPVAAKYLTTHGFQVSGVIRGGVERWIKEGLPTEKRVVKAE